MGEEPRGLSRPERELRILPDAGAACRDAAELFASSCEERTRAGKPFRVALSGGSTPREFYSLLADPAEPFRARVDWGGTHAFWGDERMVPPNDPRSNFCMAEESLLSKVPIPRVNVHRIRGEIADADEAAAEYGESLRSVFGLAGGEAPRFDLMLLGLGADGHTASLFPSAFARDDGRLAAATPEYDGVRRVTLTLRVLNASARAAFLVVGAEKAAMLHTVLDGPLRPDLIPAQAVRPTEGKTFWLVDSAASSSL